MAFGWGTKKPKEEPLSSAEIERRMAALRTDIKRLEDTIYGVALFFEGFSHLHSAQPAVIETYQKQFRNIIQEDSDTLNKAKALVEAVERDPNQSAGLKQFTVVPCKGHSNPQEMERRAHVLVEAYGRLFPGRPRSREFTEEETFSLVEEAAGAFAALD
jgi:hypothetical protein